MPKVSGVDFSAMRHFRDNVSIILMDGSTVELPLLPVKCATEGLALLQRNDTLASRYAVLQTKLRLKAKTLEELKDAIGEDEEKLTELKHTKHLDTFEETYKSMQVMQEKTAELCKESNKIRDEVTAFISPYLSDDIKSQFDQLEDRQIITILELMLYGEDALVAQPEGSEKEEENPSTQALQ